VRLGNPPLQPGTRETAVAAGRAAVAAKIAEARAAAADLVPVINAIRAEGIRSLAGIAAALTQRGIPDPARPRRVASGNRAAQRALVRVAGPIRLLEQQTAEAAPIAPAATEAESPAATPTPIPFAPGRTRDVCARRVSH
jgi:hypothetical protein